MQTNDHSTTPSRIVREGEQRDLSRSKLSKLNTKAKRAQRASKEKYYAYNS